MKAFVFNLVVATAAMLSAPMLQASGGEVSNGGDSVECTAQADQIFSGFYSLDYLMTYRHDNGNSDVIDVASWEDSRRRLVALLAEKSPDLGRFFERFAAHLDNHADYLSPYIWHEAAYGLVPIDDQRIIRRLPANCLHRSDGAINIIQSVVRVRRPNLVVFQYDPTIFMALQNERALQFSFLMVHEWLWDLTPDVSVLRDVNRFLHSTAADSLSPLEFETVLRNIGLDMSRPGFVPVCERSAAVREALEVWERHSCDEGDNLYP